MSGVDPESIVDGFEGERSTYDLDSLPDGAVVADPLDQLRTWLDEAEAADLQEPTAMTLSTVSAAGRVSSRTVLLRQLGERGPLFYTNYDSAKADDLSAHPQCAAQLLWLPLHRQVRLEGSAHKVADEQSDVYFAGRPRGSQIGAWASPQSRPIDDRATLDALVEESERRFAGADHVPRPPFWGGYELELDVVEFWQGRPNRLHDRVRYERNGDGWTHRRLAP